MLLDFQTPLLKVRATVIQPLLRLVGAAAQFLAAGFNDAVAVGVQPAQVFILFQLQLRLNLRLQDAYFQ